MAPSALTFDLATAYLDQPSFIAYGLVRGAGNLVLQQQLSDTSTLAFYVLGDGPWDSLLRLWINRKLIALPSSQAHFHPGLDGEIGSGMAAASTGGDQHVDAFWSSVPGLSTLTYSRYAWLALKVPPDPGAPSASLEVLADYQAMKCRLFDSSGNQTAFQWTQNPAWWIADRIIRKFILREAKANQPLVAAELARFDWQSFSDAAAYYDADIGGGIKRFSDGGVVYLDGSLTEDRLLEQMLLISRSYILERNGKICLYADQPRGSVFTFTIDNIVPQSFLAKKSNLRSGKNRISASFREIARASGSADDATRFSVATQRLDHEAHQRAIGVRGPGLSIIPKAKELQLDFGNNTAERVARLLQYQLVRQLGDDADPNLVYNAPFAPEWTGYEDSLKVEPGDVVTLHPSISEEFGWREVEVLEVEERPDSTRAFKGLEYEVNAFPDTAPTQQLMEASTPGTGLTLPNGIEMVRNPTFEYGDSGWTKGTGWSIESDAANAYGGSWMAKFAGSANARLVNVVRIAVRPGDSLLASCMVKRTAGDATNCQVLISWQDASLVEFALTVGNSVVASSYGSSRAVGVAPAGAFFAVIEAGVSGMSAATTAYFDQFNASLFPKHLGEVPDDDAGSGRRAIVVGSSSKLNEQGNIPAAAIGSSFFSWNMNQPAPSGPGTIKFTWAARSVPRADGTSIAVPASTALPTTAAPGLSQVAGGTLGARTRYVMIALVKSGVMLGISAESSLAIAANNLLKVTSPAAVADYDGWLPLVGVASSAEAMVSDGSASIDACLPFGTDWTEAATGYTTSGTTIGSETGTGQGIRRWDMVASTTYVWYPTLNVAHLFPYMAKARLTAGSAAAAAEQSGDGNIALSNGSISITQPAGSGSGSGSGGSGGGGRGTM